MIKKQGTLPDDMHREERGPVNRLCNEIRLFDLCEREQCSDRSGNFCTNLDLLTRFEKIADHEVRCQIEDSGMEEHDLDDGDDVYGGGFEEDEFGDESGDIEQD